MTSLNPSLRLALINKAKTQKNLLQRGFTLVELMVVIVIVGILSAVALPNFLSQTVKAKATECNAKGGAILSQVGAEHQLSQADGAALFTSQVSSDNTDSEFCTFSVTTNSSGTSSTYVLGIAGKSDISGKYVAQACIDADSMKRDLVYDTGDSAALGDKEASC